MVAGFSGPPVAENMKPKLGVVTSEFRYGAYLVQFQPCGSHWQCHHVVAYGDANGWTDEEYRVEREKAYCVERARLVELERRQRYPDKPFSMFREEDATLVVVNMEAEPLPRVIGWYVGTEEDVVLYESDDHGAKQAPADCVKVMWLSDHEDMLMRESQRAEERETREVSARYRYLDERSDRDEN